MDKEIKDPFKMYADYQNQQRQVQEVKKRGSYSKDPEELIVQEHLFRLKQEGFSIHRYESKAKKIITSSGKPIWSTYGLPVGHSDLAGVKDGIAVYIEVKAVGKLVRSHVRPAQLTFLVDKIKCGAFGIVSDGINRTLMLFYKFLSLDKDARVKFLLENLP